MEDQSAKDLRSAVAAYFNPPKAPAARVLPLTLPNGFDAEKATEQEIDRVSGAYVKSILEKPSHTVTTQEREDLRADWTCPHF
jgi:hypothetical protein